MVNVLRASLHLSLFGILHFLGCGRTLKASIHALGSGEIEEGRIRVLDAVAATAF
jgi:hypothetical protein